jgi:hypothetical protein
MGCTNFLYLAYRVNRRRRPKMAKKRTTKTLRKNLLQMTIPGPAYPIELMTKQVSEKSLVILPDGAVEA